jgi:hypothetical protein
MEIRAATIYKRCGCWHRSGTARSAQVAAAVTDPNDPKFITAQTRKQGGVMPAEQLALIFDHLDHALKVFPAEKRIEACTTLSFTTKAPIRTLILDLYPKYRSRSISIDGKVVPPSRYSNPDGQLRISLDAPRAAGAKLTGASRVFRHAAAGGSVRHGKVARRGRHARRQGSVIDTSLWGGGCDLL